MSKKNKYPNNLKEIMDSNGFSQKDLSIASKVSMSYINELYNEKAPGSAKIQGKVVTGLKKLYKKEELSFTTLETKTVFPNGTKHNPID
ncbi:helix-turn-helix domain-containing protein [Tenacibaculum litopenaei]|uniref:hypothetical protein n=1 Tax=Tenacibaculum litopenaei TaxID=396016 RepID=UPI0038B65A6A